MRATPCFCLFAGPKEQEGLVELSMAGPSLEQRNEDGAKARAAALTDAIVTRGAPSELHQERAKVLVVDWT